MSRAAGRLRAGCGPIAGKVSRSGQLRVERNLGPNLQAVYRKHGVLVTIAFITGQLHKMLPALCWICSAASWPACKNRPQQWQPTSTNWGNMVGGPPSAGSVMMASSCRVSCSIRMTAKQGVVEFAGGAVLRVRGAGRDAGAMAAAHVSPRRKAHMGGHASGS